MLGPGSPSEKGIDPQVSSENPNKNHHLPDTRPKAGARKAVTQDRDAVGQNMESYTNIFRRISLEITRPLDVTDALTPSKPNYRTSLMFITSSCIS
jgi:hypothetical protein